MRRNLCLTAAFVIAALSAAPFGIAGQAGGEHFIDQAIQGNLGEVKIGKLAQEKGTSQGVRDFGSRLASDHQTANQKAEQAAQQMNVTPPSAPGTKQKELYEKLSALSGGDFDRQFVRSMVKDHKEDIAKYQHESEQGSGPAADYARATLPTLQEHLRIAEGLARDEHQNGSSSSKASNSPTR